MYVIVVGGGKVGYYLTKALVSAGLEVTVSDLALPEGKGRISAERIDLRMARQHQKTMQFGHHNHDYNYQEHYLVRWLTAKETTP